MRVLIVGDSPSQFNTDTNVAFKGAKCEARLKEWIDYLGIKPTLINRTCENFEYWVRLYKTSKEPIIVLGNNAEQAVKRMGAEYFKLPHPSGRNRQLNDKKFIEVKLLECSVWLMS